jgi:hypothetical protein
MMTVSFATRSLPHSDGRLFLTMRHAGPNRHTQTGLTSAIQRCCLIEWHFFSHRDDENQPAAGPDAGVRLCCRLMLHTLARLDALRFGVELAG